MGLAAPRKRVKLSHDPNNTQWTRDTGGYGHKIMTAQGWQPGEILGAKNASHAEFHTAANVSHIRVFMKDDNLGLGAKKGSGLAEGECTGLDVFQSILGRLNGKDEDELTKEENSREDLKRAIYTERRWGSVRFVKGGFLVGDKIQELIDNEEKRISRPRQNSIIVVNEATENEPEPTSKIGSFKKDNQMKRKPRKAEKEEYKSSRTEIKKMKNLDKSNTLSQDVLQTKIPTQLKKSKKRKQSQETEDEINTAISNEEDVSRNLKTKENKRKREEKEAKRIVGGGMKAHQPSVSHPTASTSGSSTPQVLLGGRHAVRSRNIAQKRLAVMDTASLKQIFMIKQ